MMCNRVSPLSNMRANMRAKLKYASKYASRFSIGSFSKKSGETFARIFAARIFKYASKLQILDLLAYLNMRAKSNMRANHTEFLRGYFPPSSCHFFSSFPSLPRGTPPLPVLLCHTNGGKNPRRHNAISADCSLARPVASDRLGLDPVMARRQSNLRSIASSAAT